MDFLQRRNSQLQVEDVALTAVADQVGTPCYVYSRAGIEANWHSYDQGFGDHPHAICYAVKANSNLAVLGVLASLGSWFDIVSIGELERVLLAGGPADRIVFSGVAKTHEDLKRALLAGIHCFDVESVGELYRLDAVARELDLVAPVAIRANPDVDPETHPYIATGLRETKFGIAFDDVVDAYRIATELSNLKVVGLAAHIGSQITSAAPFIDSLDRLLELVDRLKSSGIEISHLDIGGGLGIRYHDESPPSPRSLIQAVVERIRSKGVELDIYVEPGRSIVGNAGVMLTRVEYVKCGRDRNFVVVDAGLNDLLRPALYKAWQNIVPVVDRTDVDPALYDIVGPVCETGDLLGSQRKIGVVEGDLLAILDAGAYGHVMSSNYNSRPRAPEVLVDGSNYHVVRKRETIGDLVASESLLPAN